MLIFRSGSREASSSPSRISKTPTHLRLPSLVARTVVLAACCCTPVEEYQRPGWKLVQNSFLVGDAADGVQELGLQEISSQVVQQSRITNYNIITLILTCHCLSVALGTRTREDVCTVLLARLGRWTPHVWSRQHIHTNGLIL